jgi:hypothetical protein
MPLGLVRDPDSIHFVQSSAAQRALEEAAMRLHVAETEAVHTFVQHAATRLRSQHLESSLPPWLDEAAEKFERWKTQIRIVCALRCASCLHMSLCTLAGLVCEEVEGALIFHTHFP